MARRFALVVAVVAALATAGCSAAPKGADRDLVDDWAMHAEAKVPEPAVGDCWTSLTADLRQVLAAPSAVTQTPCDLSHFFETIHVGHFTGAEADASTPPAPDTMTDAYTACDTAAKTLLGAPWQTGRVYLLLHPPTARQWKGGARFYRCDVTALRSEAGTLEEHKATFKGALQPGSELLITCGTRVGAGDSWSDITPTACTAPHDMEFLGVEQSKTATFPTDKDGLRAAFESGCRGKVEPFTGMTPSHLGKLRLSYGYWMISGRDTWKAGNRTARCYLILPKRISRSLKGAGNVAI